MIRKSYRIFSRSLYDEFVFEAPETYDRSLAETKAKKLSEQGKIVKIVSEGDIKAVWIFGEKRLHNE